MPGWSRKLATSGPSSTGTLLGLSRGTNGCGARNNDGNVRVNQDCGFRGQAEEIIKFNPADPDNLIGGMNDGRIGFNPPPAPDLAAQGFPLVGGRLDYADGRPIAAIVYRRRQHVINLFVLPARGGLILPRLGPAPSGYAMLHWTDKGLDYWAVTDAEQGELKGFKAAFEKAEG